MYSFFDLWHVLLIIICVFNLIKFRLADSSARDIFWFLMFGFVALEPKNSNSDGADNLGC